MIFDTHTHYDDRRYDGDRTEQLRSLRAAGIGGLAAVGADLASSRRAAGLAGEWREIVFAPGIHPDCVGEAEEKGEAAVAAELKELLSHPKAAALGEIGLDYHGDYPDKPSRAVQEKWFRFQLGLAKESGLPVIVHSRDAAADTLRVIRGEGGKDIPLVMHCFGYEKELAKQYLDMGHFLGIGGVVTFRNARKLKETVAFAPLSQLLLETDCPYLAPEPYRGRRNSSLYLSEVIRAIALIKETDPETVEAVTWDNALRFFRQPADFGEETV